MKPFCVRLTSLALLNIEQHWAVLWSWSQILNESEAEIEKSPKRIAQKVKIGEFCFVCAII